MAELKILTGISRSGNWHIVEPGRFVYTPPKNSSVPPTDTLLFQDRMYNGTIKATVFIKSFENRENSCFRFVIGHNCLSRQSYTCGLGGYNSAYVLSNTIDSSQSSVWFPLVLEGNYSALQQFINNPIELSLTLMGSKVTLSVAGVQVLNAILPKPIEGTQIGLFAWGDSEIEITDVYYQKHPLSAFLMIPFTEPYDRFYENLLLPIAAAKGIELKRCKDFTTPTIILNDIRNGIKGSDVLIAEISERNPNVFYEIGYAHALRKKVILISRKECLDNTPFDVKNNRIIPYDANHFDKEPFVRDFIGALDYFISRYEG